MPDPERREAALGKDIPDDVALQFAPAKNVRPDTPPTFIWQTVEDDKVVVENALTYATALLAAKIPFDLHLYEHGKHGLGLGVKPYTSDAQLHPWTHDAEFWLKQHGFLK